MKTCYYELLGVEVTASDAELKKAYRKKALQFHPDKNPDNVDEATENFATIRAAYEVLSDPQERAWYDAHKEQILNDSPIGTAEDGYYDDEDHVVDSTVTGVTTDELLMFFNLSLYTKVNDSPAGLYQIAGKIFSKLAKDEVMCGRRLGLKNYDFYQDDYFENDINEIGYLKACDRRGFNIDDSNYLFPGFGYSSTDYEYLKRFYKVWASFSTLKSFSWKDEYMYSRTYDRRTKREINKRNEKARQQARNEYNKTVKRFVSFIKKLDKRMKDGIRRAEEERLQKEEQRKKELKENINKKNNNVDGSEFEVQSWQAVEENWDEFEKRYERADEIKDDETLETSIPTNESDEIIVYECFVCKKVFKSEKQFENHTKTKSHKKKVYELQKEVRKENMTFGLDELSDLDEFKSVDGSTIDENDTTLNINVDKIDLEKLNAELAEIERQLAASPSDSDSDSDSEDNIDGKVEEFEIEIDDVSLNEEMDDKTDGVQSPESNTESKPADNKEKDDGEDDEEEEEEEEEEEDELTKILASLTEKKFQVSDEEEDWNTNNKNKKKKKSKKQNNKSKEISSRTSTPSLTVSKEPSTDNTNQTEICGTCGQVFDSRNHLFQHVKSMGHAAPTSKVKKAKKSKTKKKKNKI
ncbi:Jjj1p NDAI_0F03800 [Naumovozyma dairenensis CBS 421]|uniref:J domain-containing protein n=1 Tax=Naumovozyma dairenensis (strain ATCC 10597 / BCRC 20456 / CBS 421 / NBRC 0211 / NRRL Y-12639) TaxID=1071378 RepID=G0WD37_NAUDC|nr:hypothetical protein NDAI_0F03800 [Naumovozyma dairenensis CBS 421]CCD25698.1 hypothetical protein NDAI_0F03800 [Naumovozyma dairenensis CBS 421]